MITIRPQCADFMFNHVGNAISSVKACSSKSIELRTPSPLNVLKLICFEDKFLTNLLTNKGKQEKRIAFFFEVNFSMFYLDNRLIIWFLINEAIDKNLRVPVDFLHTRIDWMHKVDLLQSFVSREKVRSSTLTTQSQCENQRKSASLSKFALTTNQEK